MILAGPKGPKEEEEDDEAEGTSSAGDDLAGEAFDAFKSGDREGFIAAFKAAVSACKGADDSYEDDDTEGL